MLRNDAALFCCLRFGVGIDVGLRGGEERVDNSGAKRGVGQNEPAKEERHELGKA